MKNSKVYTFLFVLALSSGSLLFSTSSLSAQAYKEEVELLQTIWGMEKRDLVEQYMGLFEIDGQNFWPVYEEYAEKRKEIGAERINIIMDYANNYENMTDDKAKTITNGVFSNNMKLEKLQKQYYKKMSKVIGPLKATEFMQLEKYLDAEIRAELQANIPFLKELRQERGS